MFKRLLIAGITAGLMSTAVPASAQTSATGSDVPFMGVQFHAMWSDYTNAQRLEVLDKMAAAGVRWVRIDFGWASFQENGPDAYSQWYIDRADFVVDAARARGINVLGTLWWTPAWANNGGGRADMPTDPSQYGDFAGWMARHFKGRVAAWEIWNEPNLDDFFTGTAAQYAQLLKAAYGPIKAGDPAAQVVLGGPAHNDDTWLRKVYEAGAQGYFDVMSTHPYQGVADLAPETPDDGTKWMLTHVSAVHQLMKEYGDGDKKIWFTEFGWSSHANWAGISNWDRGVSLQEQGDYLVRTLKLVGERYPYVTNVFWYNDRNRDSGNVRNDNYGLLYRDLSPKPAYLMLKAFLIGTGSTTTPSVPEPTVTPSPDAPLPSVTPAPTPSPTVTPAPTTTETKPCSRFQNRKKKRQCLRRYRERQAALADATAVSG